MRVLWFVLFLTASASAGEYVTFASGSRLRVDRHEAEGSKVRLFADGAEVVLDASQVCGFEAAETAPPAAVPGAAPPRGQPPAAATPRPTDLAEAAAEKDGGPRQGGRSGR